MTTSSPPADVAVAPPGPNGGEGDAVAEVARERDVGDLRRAGSVQDDDRGAGADLPAVRGHVGRVVGEERPEVAGRQGRNALAQARQGLVVGEERRVRRAPEVGPGIRPPIVGIVVAGHADLVAVIDRRGAGHGELDERGEADAALAGRNVRGVELPVGRRLGARA